MRLNARLGFLIASALAVAAASLQSGCAVAKLVGGMAQSDEDQKLIEVLPKYSGLENKTVAVIVTADMSTQFEHPEVLIEIGRGITERIGKYVPGAKVLPNSIVRQWLYRTPSWESMPYGDLALQLNVDRVVYVDLLEYRLTPPGNRFVWEGVCLARIGIVERGGLEQDSFVETFDINSKFPDKEGVTRDDAAERTIAAGLAIDFVQRTSYLFYKHIEPKHPDRYRPNLDK